jgi:ATP-dependent RNA helicase DDX19/DBP5
MSDDKKQSANFVSLFQNETSPMTSATIDVDLKKSDLELQPPKSGTLKPAVTPDQPPPPISIPAGKTIIQSMSSMSLTLSNSAAVTKSAETSTTESEDEEKNTKLKAFVGVDPLDETSAILRQTNTIYSSAKTFEDLNLRPFLLQGVYALKFVKPSKIQAESLPILLSNNKPNFIGQAQNGCGKTAAYGLFMLHQINVNTACPQALCVVPVRELAIQVFDVLSSLAKFEPKLKIGKVIPKEENGKITEHVVVATPGSLLGKLKHKDLDVKQITMFVVDEADQMISRQGLGEQTLQIKTHLTRVTQQLQIVLFSSTFSKEVEKFAGIFAPRAERISIVPEQLSLDCIKQFSIELKEESKKYETLRQLFSLFSQMGQVIIFVGTIATAKTLTNQLRKDGYSVSLIYGQGMAPVERDKVMSDFRSGKSSILITTNVISRGIDVISVNLTINYNLPMTRNGNVDYENYLQRIGRGGRFGRRGAAVSFTTNEKEQSMLKMIANHYKTDITNLPQQIEQMEAVLLKALK